MHSNLKLPEKPELKLRNNKNSHGKYDKNIEKLYLRLNDFRDTGYLHDFNVKTLDGDKIPVHKLVLSARSDILAELIDSNPEELKLKYNNRIVNAFITHVYTGSVPQLNPVEALQLLHCSLAHGFDFLSEHCSLIAKKAINLKNCVDILLTANDIKYPDLIKDCFQYLQIHFKQMAKLENQLSLLPLDMLIKLLSSRTLNGDEDDVFKVFMNWRQENRDASPEAIKHLFKCIKMERLSLSSLRAIVKGQCEQQCFDWCSEKALELISVVTSEFALSRRLSDCLVIICNFRKSEPNAYDLFSDSWIDANSTDQNCTCAPLLVFDRYSEKQHIAFDDELIIVTGGIGDNHEPVKSTWIYRMETEDWIQGPNMNKARHSHASCKVGNNLYVVGGYGAKDTIEKYNYSSIKSQEWIRLENLKEPRLLHFCEQLTINDAVHLVVVGGCNEAISKTVEALNVDSEEWRSMSPMHLARVTSMHGVSGNRLFVFSITEDLSKSGEYYDAKMNQWTFLGNLDLTPFSCKMLLLNNSLYGLCRTKDSEILSVVKFDTSSFKWSIINKTGPKFPASYMVHKFSNIKLDTNYAISLA